MGKSLTNGHGPKSFSNGAGPGAVDPHLFKNEVEASHVTFWELIQMAHTCAYNEIVEEWDAKGKHWVRKRCSCGNDIVEES